MATPRYEQEDAFWKGYCEIELENAKLYSQASNQEKLSLLRRMGATLKAIFSPVQNQTEKDFRIFFLHKTMVPVFCAFLFDISALTIMLGRTPTSTDKGNTLSENYWYTQSIIWIALTILCGLFYTLFALGARNQLAIVGTDVNTGLNIVGGCILLARGLVFLQSLLSMFLHGDARCIEDVFLSPIDRSFKYVGLMMATDLLQVIIFSLLPMRLIWIASLAMIEASRQITKLQTCKGRLGLEEAFEPFVMSQTIVIIVTFVVAALMPAVVLEKSAYSSYHNLLRSKAAAANKRSLVNLLCADLKTPAQQTRHILNEVTAHLPVFEDLKIFPSLDSNLSSIATVVDHILFLIRMHEGRFAFLPSQPVHLERTVKNMLHSVLCTLGRGEQRLDGLFECDLSHATVRTDKHCFTILLFYSLSALLISIPPNDNTPMKITANAETIRHGAGGDRIVVVLDGTRSTNRTQDLPPSEHHHYQTCLMFCQQVAAACGGEFIPTVEGGVRFTVPCVRCDDLQTIGRLGCESIRPFSLASSNNSEDGMPEVELAIVKQMCMYSSDLLLTRMATDALGQLLGGMKKEVAMFDQLNMVDMMIRSVVIVTSLTTCGELRRKGFKGRIVLMSDRLAYLDDGSRAHFNYGVTLPCVLSELHALAHWLNAEHSPSDDLEEDVVDPRRVNFQRWSSNLHSSIDMPLALSSKIKPTPAVAVTNEEPTIFTWVPQIPRSRMLNYTRWRLLNPGSHILHHSNTLDIMLAAGFLQTMALSMFETRETFLIYTAGTSSHLLAFFLRRLDMRHLNPMGDMFFRLVQTFCIVFTYAAFVQMYREFTKDNVFVRSSEIDARTLNDFLNSTYGGYTGRQHLLSLLTSIGTMKVVASYFIWPYSFRVIFLILIRVLVVIRVIMLRFIGYRNEVLLSYTYFLFFCVVCGVLIYTETTYRREFTELRDFIISKDFLERCITAGWRDTRTPLAAITTLQQDILARANREATHLRLGISSPLLHSLDKMHSNVIVSRELLMEMQMSLQSHSPRSATDLITGMSLQFIKPLVHRICSYFARDAASNGVSIKISMQVQSNVLLVRCDKDLLEAVICSACRTAVARIESYGKKCRRYAAMSQELLVVIAAQSAKDLKFSDLQMLQVLVFDTAPPIHHDSSADKQFTVRECIDSPDLLQLDSSSRVDLVFTYPHVLREELLEHAAPHSDACLLGIDRRGSIESSFMEGVYGRYLKQHGQSGFHELREVNDATYKQLQRIGVPFKRCPQTPKIASYFADKYEMPQRVQKSHLPFFARYLQDYAALPVAEVKQKQHKHRNGKLMTPGSYVMRKRSMSSRAYIDGSNLLTIFVLDSKRKGGSVMLDMVNLSLCYDFGWERRVLYIKSGDMPEFASILTSMCVVFDPDLVQASLDKNRQYAQDVVLFLRCHHFLGVIALCQLDADDDSMDTSVDSRPSSAKQLDGSTVHESVSDRGQELASSKEMVLDPDLVVHWPLTRRCLLDLKAKHDKRLIELALPSLE